MNDTAGTMSSTVRVMLVDGAPERAYALEQALKRSGYDVIANITSTIDLHPRVLELKPDVIIINMDSPDRDTLENLSVLNRGAPRPVVMFTNDDDNQKMREAVRAGVSAYVVDGLAAERMRAIIEVAVARFEQFQALRKELTETEGRLAERKVIERAKGILMKSRKLTEEEAYRALRKMAMDRNLRLAQVAERVIAASELLG